MYADYFPSNFTFKNAFCVVCCQKEQKCVYFVLSFNVSEIYHLALAVVPFSRILRCYVYMHHEMRWWWSCSSVNLKSSMLWTMTMKCENLIIEVRIGFYLYLSLDSILSTIYLHPLFMLFLCPLYYYSHFFITLVFRIRPNFYYFIKNDLLLQEFKIHLFIL